MTAPATYARLVELFAQIFDAGARRLGAEYARGRRVALVTVDANHAHARVRGQGGVYAATLAREPGGNWAAACSCLVFRSGMRCKHVWALCVALDEAGWRFESDGAFSLRGARLARTSAWRARLAEIRSASTPNGPPPVAAREERVLYFLMLDLCIEQGTIVIDTRKSYRRKNGAWSKPARFTPFAYGRIAQVAEPDRHILAYLKGASGPRYGLARGTFEIEDDVAEWVLPLMARSGGLYWSESGRESSAPLEYDGDEPWRLRRSLRTDGASGELVLDGEWRKGERATSLRDTLALLPGGFIVFADRIGRVAERAEAFWARSLDEDGPIRVPEAERGELLREIARAGDRVDLDGVPDAVRRDVAPEPHLALEAPAVAGGSIRELPGRIEFDYAGSRVAPDDTSPLVVGSDSLIARDCAAERALIARATELGAQPAAGAPNPLTVPIPRLDELTRVLTAEGWVVEGEGARYRAASRSRLALASGVDWFDLHGELDFGGASAALPVLLAAARRKELTVRLGDGSIGILPEEWLARFSSLVGLGQVRDGRVRFRSNQAWLLDALLAERDDVRTDARFREQVERLRDFKRIEPVAEPNGFRGELRPYQREGLGWLDFLERHGLGGCLADDMGLGKTVQVLAWLVARRARRGERLPALVVAPKSLTHNWIAEARRFAPQLSTLDYTGKTRRALHDRIACADLVVTTYGALRMDVELLGDERFDCAILDEAQAIKNADSQTAKAARLLRADHRLALSGTPIENHLGELWSLFEFLNPGMLGRSTVFSELVDAPRDSALEGDTRALLSQVVRPFVLRRTKEQVLSDLPSKTEQTVTCDLEPGQRAEYDELRRHYRSVLLAESGEPDGFTVLEALLRLRQAACHPGLIDPRRTGETSAKLAALFEMVDEVLEAGHKALVFSQFTSLLAIVRARVEAGRIPHAYLDGSTRAQARETEIQRFQHDRDCKLFLLSLKAGGVGLNLTAADYVFLLDPWWNPAVESQAIGRAHRIGQTRSVFAYRFVCADTIEERVLELQAKKRELAAVILEGEATTLRDLTRADLERLLR